MKHLCENRAVMNDGAEVLKAGISVVHAVKLEADS